MRYSAQFVKKDINIETLKKLMKYQSSSNITIQEKAKSLLKEYFNLGSLGLDGSNVNSSNDGNMDLC